MSHLYEAISIVKYTRILALFMDHNLFLYTPVLADYPAAADGKRQLLSE
jgi:hypothetical protein